MYHYLSSIQLRRQRFIISFGFNVTRVQLTGPLMIADNAHGEMLLGITFTAMHDGSFTQYLYICIIDTRGDLRQT